jgi:hypothetical protein
MNCSHCQSPIPANAKFCFECGKPAADSSDKPDSLRRFQSLLDDFAADGVLDDYEQREVESERIKLGIRKETADRMLNALDLFIGIPFQIDVEITSFERLRCGHRGECAFQFTPSRRFQSVETLVWASADDTIHPTMLRSPRPGSARSFTVPLLPEKPGTHSFEIWLKATTRDGKEAWFTSPRPMQMQIGKEASSVENLSITFGDKAVGQINDLNLDQGSDSGLVRQKWIPLPMEPRLPIEAEDWQRKHSGRPGRRPYQQASKSRSNRAPRIKDLLTGQPPLKPRLSWSHNGADRTCELHTTGKATFGRDQQRSDVRLFVEPIMPVHLNAQNISLSKKISSRHFQVQASPSQIEDLGSSNGTTAAGRKLYPQNPLPLSAATELDIAGVLSLRAEPIPSSEGKGSVLLKRISNTPEKSYLVLGDGVGIWPKSSDLFGPLERNGQPAPLALQRIDSLVCIVNTGGQNCRIEQQPVGPGEAVPLRGDTAFVELGDWMMVVG